MLDHTGIVVPEASYDKTLEFYLAALGPLGYKQCVEIPNIGVGLGTSMQECDFWVCKSATRGISFENGKGIHWAFKAQTHEQVDAFHAAAMKVGATCNGEAGFRKQYHPFYYAAFVYDPVGNNVEVVCHCPEEAGKKGEDVAAIMAKMKAGKEQA